MDGGTTTCSKAAGAIVIDYKEGFDRTSIVVITR